MSRSTLTARERWKAEQSFLIHIPRRFVARNLDELRGQLQDYANQYEGPPLGNLEYRYELDSDHDKPVKIHAYFRGMNGRRHRFMRLARG